MRFTVFQAIRFAALFLILGLAARPADISAQQEFQFHGVWVGDFEDRTEPERDMATRGGASLGGGSGAGRDRMIAGRGQYRCDGEMRLDLRGPNDNLRGTGELDQQCKAARSGLWQIPTEVIGLSDFEFEDEGEGREKKLEFRFEVRYRTPPGQTASNELIRCDAEGEYKPDDDAFEGEYDCRHVTRMQQASGRETFAIRIRGDFKLTRAGM